MNPPTNEPPLPPLAVGDRGASQLSGLSTRTIAELVSRNAIPSFKIGNRRLFSVKALDAWVDAMSAAAESEAGHVE
jgi:excisionase family DNA binding protein